MTTSTQNPTAWQRTHASQHALRTLTDAVASDPERLPGAVQDALGAFDSLDDLLLRAHAHWARTFDAHVDGLVEAGAHGDDAAFARVWSELARLQPGAALLLEHHADHPAVVRAHAQHVRRIQRLLDVTLPDSWAAPSRSRQRSHAPRIGCLRLPRLRVA